MVERSVLKDIVYWTLVERWCIVYWKTCDLCIVYWSVYYHMVERSVYSLLDITWLKDHMVVYSLLDFTWLKDLCIVYWTSHGLRI